MNQMNGSYRATVTDINDKTGSMKAQVKVNGLMDGIPDEALPWAEYLLPIGYTYTPVNEGDLVWVDFPYDGDTRRPRIIGAAMDWQGDPNDPKTKGKPNIAPQAGGHGAAYQPPKVQGQPALPTYKVTQDQVISRNGILEVRTIGGGYTITNMAKHAIIGFNEDGDIIISTTGNVFIHAGADLTLDSGGNMTLKTAGKFELDAGTAEYKAGQHAFTK